MYSVIDKYIKYVESFLTNYYKILLGDDYEKKIVDKFIKKYIDVRYFNNSIYDKEKKFINKINKELKVVATELMNENSEKSEKIKNIFALFSYILYIDDCLAYSNIKTLMKTLFNDKNIKLIYTDETKAMLDEEVRNYIIERKKFFKLFDNKEFELKYKRLKNNLYFVDIAQNCKIPAIFSDYAIDKAYNSVIVTENKFYLMCLLLSSAILESSIALNFDKKYVIDFPVTLIDKQKKLIRYLKLFDDDMFQDFVILRFTYKYYLENKAEINKLINSGINVSVILDETFVDDYESLVLFSYVFIYEKYDYYDIIIDSKDEYKTTFVTL